MKKRIFFRVFPFNRFTIPLLLNVWESHGMDRWFHIHPIGDGLVPDFGPEDVIVYSFMTPHLPVVAGEIRRIRDAGSARSQPLIAGGGPHVTGEQELAGAIGFDVLFAGPGEEAFLRFGQDLIEGKVKKEKTVYDARDALPDAPSLWMKYIPISRYLKTIPPLEIMRGCFWHCRYCQTGSGKPEFRNDASIVTYLAEMKRRHLRRVSFISPSALEFGAERSGRVNLERIESLLSRARSLEFPLVEYGIFPSEIRPENASREAFALLKRYVANKRLTIGAQSGLDEQLAFLARGHSAADIENAVGLAGTAGFQVNLDFIFALPGETAEQRRQNLEFILSLQKKYRLHAHLHHFFPLAGTEFAFRFPSFLAEEEKQKLVELRRRGVATDWWLEGEKKAREYFAWLRRDFPAFYDRYN